MQGWKKQKQKKKKKWSSISSQVIQDGENDGFYIVQSKSSGREVCVHYQIISEIFVCLVKPTELKYFLLSSLPRMKPESHT